jgi:hypothetical protein
MDQFIYVGTKVGDALDRMNRRLDNYTVELSSIKSKLVRPSTPVNKIGKLECRMNFLLSKGIPETNNQINNLSILF